MPNWVYSSIRVKASAEKVQEVLDKGGLCEAYMPMPKELRNVTSPVQFISIKEFEEQDKSTPYGLKITQEMSDRYKEEYGSDNWYDWANIHWNTKWGDVRTEMEVDNASVTIKFETAWSPLSWDMIERIDKDLDIIEYWWEEEQGYGAMYMKMNNDIVMAHEWDLPDWEEKQYEDSEGNFVMNLLSDHITAFSETEAGFYIEGHPDMPWEGEPSELKEFKTPF